MTNYELVSIIIQSVGFIAVLVGLFITGRQLNSSYKIHAENHDWNRRVATANAVKDTHVQQHFSKINDAFSFSNAKHTIPLSEILEKTGNNKQLTLSLHHVLNYFDELSNGIFHGVYDEELVSDTWKSTMLRLIVVFNEYIKYRQNEIQPYAWCSFCNFVERFEKAAPNRQKTGGLGV